MPRKKTDLRFILKVDQGRTFTLCPIMDILWRVGCLLNTTRSPSLTFTCIFKK